MTQGCDTTSADMIEEDRADSSDLLEFYAGATVFITGATGFLGKILLEKLLRTCNVKRIYVLIRSKKGKDSSKRFEEIFEAACFDVLRQTKKNCSDNVFIVDGDVSLPNLGLNDKDREMLVKEVDVIFHCAATVRFDEPLKQATYINVRAPMDLLRMAKEMKQLRAFVHVSTVFSNCPRKDIDEEVYDTKITGQNLLTVCDALDEDTVNEITPVLLGNWPNTYVFTKAVAEEVVRSHGKGLPVAIIRPSIVISTNKEPVAGWIDNLYGATGVLVGACLGVMRSLQADPNVIAEMVPADYVINTTLAAAWDVATVKRIDENDSNPDSKSDETRHNGLTVYNFVSSPEKPITWDGYMQLAEKHAQRLKSPLLVWYPIFKLRPNRYWHLIAVFFLHTIPAYLVDFILVCIGKKRMLVKGYKKIGKFSEVITYFATREWKFNNDNVQNLWKKLKPKDRELFEFSMKIFDWDTYFQTYTRGCRVYLLKDPLDTIPQGEVKYRKLQIAHYALSVVLVLLAYKLISFLLCFAFQF